MRIPSCKGVAMQASEALELVVVKKPQVSSSMSFVNFAVILIIDASLPHLRTLSVDFDRPRDLTPSRSRSTTHPETRRRDYITKRSVRRTSETSFDHQIMRREQGIKEKAPPMLNH